MSENSTPEERTEMPTDKRMDQLRRDGSLYSSQDVVTAASLMAGMLSVYLIWSFIVQDMRYILIKAFTMIGNSEPLTPNDLYQGAMGILFLFGPDLLFISATIGFVAGMSLMMQTDFNIREKIIKFDFKTLNPVQGFKKVFSIQGVTTTFKALIKLGIILPIGYYSLKAFAPEMIMLMHLTVDQILHFTGALMFQLFLKIMYVLIIIAIIDYMWGKFQWLKSNKMTKQEVKDEKKAIEGDEATKKKIQAKGLQRIVQRIRDSVPQADVVITNPTHYAVALKYQRGEMDAPRVVAKGKGFLALRIRELAKESGVPVLERKELARALYSSTEVGGEISGDLFRAVAKVLAYVYRLKSPHRSANV